MSFEDKWSEEDETYVLHSPGFEMIQKGTSLCYRRIVAEPATVETECVYADSTEDHWDLKLDNTEGFRYD